MTARFGEWFLRLGALAVLLGAAPVGAVCGDGILDPAEGCDDGNLASGDCCDSVCAFEPAESPCDDGDPCTADDACRLGVCGGRTPDPAACLDHYMCYGAVATTPFAPTVLGLVDALGPGAADVVRPAAFCPPASKNGGGVLDSATHQESYLIRPDARRRGDFDVADQFGPARLFTSRAQRLLVPTTKGLGAPPASPPAAGAADHYACYRVRAKEGRRSGVRATVTDQFESRLYELRGPQRLCLPVDKEGEGLVNPRGHLLCYRAKPAPGEAPHAPVVGQIFTANQLGGGRLDTLREEELCVPALRTACVVPRCREVIRGQRPNCDYNPVVSDPTFPFCAGPLILVDRTHRNFHTVTPEDSTFPGRYWAFARFLSRDGYEVRDSDEAPTALLPGTDARILVIANPETGTSNPADDAIPPADVAAIVGWVSAGGSLLLIIDHRPRERVDGLLTALGLVRLFDGGADRHTFTRVAGDLVGSAEVVNGPDPATTAVDEVLTIGGTAFSLSPTPPAGATYEPVLVFPPGVEGRTGGTRIDLAGYLQGVAIRFGAGRVYVSGEAGAFTAQHGPSGLVDGPDNARFLRNIVYWLTPP